MKQPSTCGLNQHYSNSALFDKCRMVQSKVVQQLQSGSYVVSNALFPLAYFLGGKGGSFGSGLSGGFGGGLSFLGFITFVFMVQQ